MPGIASSVRARLSAAVDTPHPGALPRPSWSGLRPLLSMAGLAAVYYAAAKIGYALEFAGPVAAVLWLRAGVGIAFLSVGGLALWPGVLLGDLLVNDYSALPLGSALGQTAGNVLEVLTVAWLMRRLTDAPLLTVRGLARMLVAIVAGCVVS